jgi:hypothetical protein
MCYFNASGREYKFCYDWWLAYFNLLSCDPTECVLLNYLCFAGNWNPARAECGLRLITFLGNLGQIDCCVRNMYYSDEEWMGENWDREYWDISESILIILLDNMKIVKALKLKCVSLFWISYNRSCLSEFQGRIRGFNLILSTKLTRVSKYDEVEKVNIRATNLGFEHCTSRYFPTPSKYIFIPT